MLFEPTKGPCKIVCYPEGWYVVNEYWVKVSPRCESYGEAVMWARGDGYDKPTSEVHFRAGDRPIGGRRE